MTAPCIPDSRKTPLFISSWFMVRRLIIAKELTIADIGFLSMLMFQKTSSSPRTAGDEISVML